MTTAPVAAVPGSGEDQMTKAVAGHTLEQAELRVVRGTYKGLSCPLSAGTVFIGRSSECDLALKGAQGVSRRHCKVQYLGTRFVVIDLESRNGTIVNGQSVERKVLEKGDRIEVGDEIVEFHVESLDDLRSVLLQDGGIEDAVTAQMPQGRSTQAEASRPVRPAPAAMDFDPPTLGIRVEKPAVERPEQTERVRRDVEPLPETLPPRGAMAGLPDDDLPPPLPPGTVPELSSPYVHQAKAAPSSSRAPLAFGLVALAIVAGGVFLLWDLSRDDVVEPVDTIVMTTPTPTTTTTTTTPAPPVEPAPVPTTPPPPVVEPTPVVEPPPAPAVQPAPTTTTTAAAIFVRAKGGGRAQTIKVKVGDAVTPGTVLIVVSGDGGSLGRKLESLRREEKEFAAAAAKDPAAKADLDYIRAEMKKIEAKLKPRDLVADAAGVVAEILVETGGVVRDGAPIVKLTP